MKDVRPVAVDQDPRVVELVVRVAADMVAAIEDEDPLVELVRQPFRDDATGEAGADHDDVMPHGQAVPDPPRGWSSSKRCRPWMGPRRQ